MTITIIAKGITEQDAMRAVEDAHRMLERHGTRDGIDEHMDRSAEVKCDDNAGR